MNRYPRVVAALFLLSCASASAKDFYITAFGGDYETVYAVSPESIVDLGDGVKRADLLAVGITRIEMEKGVFVTTGDLDVMVIEVKCQASPRQFKEDSEYVQFSRSSERIDKSTLNPYKDWAPVPDGSDMEEHARFICQWPEIKELTGLVKLPAESDWDFVNSVTDTVARIKNK